MINIVLAVTNDIVTDNRLHKVATSLNQNGYRVTIVGRRYRNSAALFNRSYFTRRFRLWFNKSSLFYANYNLRLFFYLMRVQVDMIVSNDLDTLPACWLASKLRGKVLIFDSHEMFTEVPELVNRRIVKNVWELLERFLVPKVDFGYTVSKPIQTYYKDKYNQQFELVRNVGYFRYDYKFKSDFSETIILYQGAVNLGRGLELMINTLSLLENVKLWIIGNGDILPELKTLVKEKKVDDKVLFFGRIRINELPEYTSKAHIGISLEEDLGLNYRYALPNKIFDYIQARVPVIVSDLPEMGKLVGKYQIGQVLRTRSPESLAELIENMRTDRNMMKQINQKLELAARELCWQREEEKLIVLYRHAYEQVNTNNA